MKLSRIFAMLMMVLLIVGGTIIVYSWAQAPYRPRPHYGSVGGASITFSPNSNSYQPATPSSSGGITFGDATVAASPYPGSIMLAAAAPNKSWSPEQACGPPDTGTAGDYPTAWASRHPDGSSDEWLSVTYDPPVDAVGVLVYESFNPGAIGTVNLYDESKRLLKTLEQPAGQIGEAKRSLVLPVGAQLDGKVSRVDVVVRSQLVPGWNEIDAVGLIDVQGQTHWAKTATASSTFAEVIASGTFGFSDNSAHEMRIQRLEQQVAELRSLVQQLEHRLTPGIRPAKAPSPFLPGQPTTPPMPSPPMPTPPGPGGYPTPYGAPTPGSLPALPGTAAPAATPGLPGAGPTAPRAPTGPAPAPAPQAPGGTIDSSTGLPGPSPANTPAGASSNEPAGTTAEATPATTELPALPETAESK